MARIFPARLFKIFFLVPMTLLHCLSYAFGVVLLGGVFWSQYVCSKANWADYVAERDHPWSFLQEPARADANLALLLHEPKCIEHIELGRLGFRGWALRARLKEDSALNWAYVAVDRSTIPAAFETLKAAGINVDEAQAKWAAKA